MTVLIASISKKYYLHLFCTKRMVGCLFPGETRSWRKPTRSPCGTFEKTPISSSFRTLIAVLTRAHGSEILVRPGQRSMHAKHTTSHPSPSCPPAREVAVRLGFISSRKESGVGLRWAECSPRAWGVLQGGPRSRPFTLGSPQPPSAPEVPLPGPSRRCSLLRCSLE